METISVAECRKQAGSIVHKVLHVSKRGALVSYFFGIPNNFKNMHLILK